jgi:hypothetical protein
MTIVYAGKKINLLVYLFYSFFLSFFEGKGKKKEIKKNDGKAILGNIQDKDIFPLLYK